MPIRNINIAPNAAIATSKIAEDGGLTSSHMGTAMRTGFLPIQIGNSRILGSTSGEIWANGSVSAGGQMSSVTAPAWTQVSSLILAQRIVWSSAATAQIMFPPVALPPDLTTASSASLNWFGGLLDASTDTGATYQVTVTRSSGSSGGTGFWTSSVAVSSASTVASTHRLALVNSSILAGYPNYLNFRVGVKSTSDVIAMYTAWIEYTRH